MAGEKVMVIYQKIKRTIDDTEIECEICDESEHLYHRTLAKNLESIKSEGIIKPSEDTKVISLSASEAMTYGGTVRLKLKRLDIPKVQQMCYVESHTPSSKAYEEKRDELAREHYSLNRAYADLGMTHAIYKRECESFTREPVSVDKVNEVEYWIAPSSEIIEESDVNCERHYPHYIDGTGWSGATWDKIQKYLKKTKDFADSLGIPFKAKTCFPYVRLGWNRYIALDDKNLELLSQGKEPIVTEGSLPKDEDCRC